jgi:membrane protein DedA with SNARE-associated domain
LILVGALFEGESVLLSAALVAHQGHLSLPLIILAGWCGGVLGDQFFFFLGYFRGRSIVQRRKKWAEGIDYAAGIVGKHGLLVIVGFRFLYGLRMVIPFALGCLGISKKCFLILNALGALVWATSFTLCGYFLSAGLTIVFTDPMMRLVAVLFVVTAAALALCLHCTIPRIRRARRQEQTTQCLSEGRALVNHANKDSAPPNGTPMCADQTALLRGGME